MWLKIQLMMLKIFITSIKDYFRKRIYFATSYFDLFE